jgi:hypothetical protein
MQMATKLGRKEMPAGKNASEFKYQGRPSRDQDDFGAEVGIADCGCVNQFGENNNSKYYSAGVVKDSSGAWYVYLEWGRIFSGKSWIGNTFKGQDFMFVVCDGEADARKFFQTQLRSKNIKRMEKKSIGGKDLWAAKSGDDAYFVQRLATREKGLPDACTIGDDSGMEAVKKPSPTPTAKTKAAPKVAKTFHPQVVSLAQALVGGVRTYTKTLVESSGIKPTMSAILDVRDQYIPLAMQRIKSVGDSIDNQIADAGLRDLSRLVFSMIPRYIPRQGITDREAILSSDNIARLQQDLDTFEAALLGEAFTKADSGPVDCDPDSLLNARLTWLDPQGEGKAVVAILLAMTNNRHGYLSSSMKVKNLFRVDRPDRDEKFLANVKLVGDKRKGKFGVKARLQPKVRQDLTGDEAELYGKANVILTQHGTRSVNVSPIIQTHFRLPKQLPGALICGANFGHGTYTATDYRKAVGYTSYERSAWGNGGGGISGRGAFMFLTETLMGDAYLAPSTGSWNSPPNGKDSVFGRGGDRGHQLQNDEHVVFDPHYNRIRYLVEFTF